MRTAPTPLAEVAQLCQQIARDLALAPVLANPERHLQLAQLNATLALIRVVESLVEVAEEIAANTRAPERGTPSGQDRQ